MEDEVERAFNAFRNATLFTAAETQWLQDASNRHYAALWYYRGLKIGRSEVRAKLRGLAAELKGWLV